MAPSVIAAPALVAAAVAVDAEVHAAIAAAACYTDADALGSTASDAHEWERRLIFDFESMQRERSTP
eukprot:10265450-Lingulodinium_polyedra.AAC.1